MDKGRSSEWPNIYIFLLSQAEMSENQGTETSKGILAFYRDPLVSVQDETKQTLLQPPSDRSISISGQPGTH